MSDEQRLNQVLAIEKGSKGRAESALKIGYQQAGHPDLFQGMSRQYTPFEDTDRIEYPPEVKNVQLKAREIVTEAQKIMADLWNVTATKDIANCTARADLVVDGQVLAEGLPATYLLFMEKQLLNMRALIGKLPVLDEAQQWEWDENAQLFRSTAQKVHKTKKVQRPVVLYDATEKHPAQTQLITEDVPVGTYSTTQLSACIPVKEKKAMQERIEKLERAVKQARERANMTAAVHQDVAAPLFKFILGG